MASEPEISASEMQSFLERLITSRNRDLSVFLPVLLGFASFDSSQTQSNTGETGTDPVHNSPNHPTPSDHNYQTRSDSGETRTDPVRNSENDHTSDDQNNQRVTYVLINPATQGMVVIEGTGMDSLLRGIQSNKEGQPPASRSAIEAMPSVETVEGEEVKECVICLEECVVGEVVKEMPCKHRFHGKCIEKWLGIHGTCPVCRYNMPVEEGKKGEEVSEERRGGQREIWVSFAFGHGRRRTEEERGSNDNESNARDSDSGTENHD